VTITIVITMELHSTKKPIEISN